MKQELSPPVAIAIAAVVVIVLVIGYFVMNRGPKEVPIEQSPMGGVNNGTPAIPGGQTSGTSPGTTTGTMGERPQPAPAPK